MRPPGIPFVTPGTFQTYGIAPGPEDAKTFQEAVLVYARLLETRAEFEACGAGPGRQGGCYLLAFGIHPPSQGQLDAARDAVIGLANAQEPARGLVEG